VKRGLSGAHFISKSVKTEPVQIKRQKNSVFENSITSSTGSLFTYRRNKHVDPAVNVPHICPPI
jgi:hypothetical protein